VISANGKIIRKKIKTIIGKIIDFQDIIQLLIDGIIGKLAGKEVLIFIPISYLP
jgi:hypothetical protein